MQPFPRYRAYSDGEISLFCDYGSSYNRCCSATTEYFSIWFAAFDCLKSESPESQTWNFPDLSAQSFLILVCAWLVDEICRADFENFDVVQKVQWGCIGSFLSQVKLLSYVTRTRDTTDAICILGEAYFSYHKPIFVLLDWLILQLYYPSVMIANKFS